MYKLEDVMRITGLSSDTIYNLMDDEGGLDERRFPRAVQSRQSSKGRTWIEDTWIKADVDKWSQEDKYF